MICSGLFDFSSWTPKNWIGQVFGILAVISFCLSYIQKKPHMVIVWQLAGDIFWVVNMSIFGMMAGVLLNAVGGVRSVIFCFREKHEWARHWIWNVIFIICFVGCAVFSYFFGDGWLGILPSAAMIVATVALTFKKAFHIRLSIFGSCPLWLIYDTFLGNPAAMINEILCMASAIAGFLFIDLKEFRKKKKPGN